MVCNVHFTMPPEIRTVELMTCGETEEGVGAWVPGGVSPGMWVVGC